MDGWIEIEYHMINYDTLLFNDVRKWLIMTNLDFCYFIEIARNKTGQASWIDQRLHSTTFLRNYFLSALVYRICCRINLAIKFHCCFQKSMNLCWLAHIKINHFAAFVLSMEMCFHPCCLYQISELFSISIKRIFWNSIPQTIQHDNSIEILELSHCHQSVENNRKWS